MKNNELTEVNDKSSVIIEPFISRFKELSIEHLIAQRDALVAENEKLKSTIKEINNELYGQGFEVLGWHLNGDTEPLDNWFTDNGWGTPETPATDAAIAEIKASELDDLAKSIMEYAPVIESDEYYVYEAIAKDVTDRAANLLAGRKGGRNG